MSRHVRQTKIIFTIGPATSDTETLTRLIEGGVDVCRFNMAHIDHAWFRAAIQRVRECSDRAGRRIAVLMDVKGPEIRTSDLPQPIDLGPEDLVEFFYQPSDEAADDGDLDGELTRVGVNYPDLAT